MIDGRLAQVVTHLRNLGKDGGEECLASWPTQGLSVEDAFSQALKYLADQVPALSSALQVMGS